MELGKSSCSLYIAVRFKWFLFTRGRSSWTFSLCNFTFTRLNALLYHPSILRAVLRTVEVQRIMHYRSFIRIHA